MKVIIDQPFGIGDILFLSPLVANLDVQHGLWPVVDHYMWIKEYVHIPNVEFIPFSSFNHNIYSKYTTVPFQHAHSHIPHAQDCMEAKYLLLNAPLQLWRTLKFDRKAHKEEQLKKILNIDPNEEYIVVNNNFAGPEYGYKTKIQIDTTHRIVHQRYINGFTLLDWCLVLEQAVEIHTVSTSLFFVIEALRLTSTPKHLYPRKPIDRDLSPIKTLINNDWICHE